MKGFSEVKHGSPLSMRFLSNITLEKKALTPEGEQSTSHSLSIEWQMYRELGTGHAALLNTT